MNNFNRNSSSRIRSQHIIATGLNMPDNTNFNSISQSDEMYNGYFSIRGTLSDMIITLINISHWLHLIVMILLIIIQKALTHILSFQYASNEKILI